MAEDKKNKRPHRDRKNPTAHEQWKKRKKAANDARGKQFAPPIILDDGVASRDYFRV